MPSLMGVVHFVLWTLIKYAISVFFQLNFSMEDITSSSISSWIGGCHEYYADAVILWSEHYLEVAADGGFDPDGPGGGSVDSVRVGDVLIDSRYGSVVLGVLLLTNVLIDQVVVGQGQLCSHIDWKSLYLQHQPTPRISSYTNQSWWAWLILCAGIRIGRGWIALLWTHLSEAWLNIFFKLSSGWKNKIKNRFNEFCL